MEKKNLQLFPKVSTIRVMLYALPSFFETKIVKKKFRQIQALTMGNKNY